MNRIHRLVATGCAVVMGAGLVTAPIAARASEEGRRNTALGLGAAAAYLLLSQRNKTAGIAAAAGAAYAYKRYDDSVRARHQWENYGYYNDRYDRNGYNDSYDRNNYNYDRNGYRGDRNNDNYDRNGYNDRNSHNYDRNGYNDRYDRNNGDRYYRGRH
jgi:hypothetical protein